MNDLKNIKSAHTEKPLSYYQTYFSSSKNVNGKNIIEEENGYGIKKTDSGNVEHFLYDPKLKDYVNVDKDFFVNYISSLEKENNKLSSLLSLFDEVSDTPPHSLHQQQHDDTSDNFEISVGFPTLLHHIPQHPRPRLSFKQGLHKQQQQRQLPPQRHCCLETEYEILRKENSYLRSLLNSTAGKQQRVRQQ